MCMYVCVYTALVYHVCMYVVYVDVHIPYIHTYSRYRQQSSSAEQQRRAVHILVTVCIPHVCTAGKVGVCIKVTHVSSCVSGWMCRRKFSSQLKGRKGEPTVLYRKLDTEISDLVCESIRQDSVEKEKSKTVLS